MYRRWMVLAVAPLAMAACQKMETPEQGTARMQDESAAARPLIEAANQRHARAINGNMGDSLAMLYTENGVMMPPGAPVVTGRDAIRASVTAQPMPPGSQLTFQTVSLSVNGPLAVERGSYVFTMPDPRRGQPAITTNGKYLAHWHKVGDEWQIAEATWSDDTPMMAPSGGNN
jgi:ketosteroid isomerase-like protein